MLHKTSDYIQGELLLFKFFGKVEVSKIFHGHHEKYLQLFRNPKDIKFSQRNDPVKLPEEYAMKYVARSIKNLSDKFCMSIELHELYKDNKREESKS